MKHIYPELNYQTIRLVQKLYADNPTYLDDPDCPYPKDIIELFKGEVQAKYFDVQNTPTLALTNDSQIAAEIDDIYSKLKQYWEEVKNSDKSADKNTFFRVSAGLLEKLVELRERMSKIKKVNSFISETLDIFDCVLTADQRNEVMERLEKYNEQEDA